MIRMSVFVLLFVLSAMPVAVAAETDALKFKIYGGSISYDLTTVNWFHKRKFSIESVSVEDADIIDHRIKVLQQLVEYCAKPAGKYPAPESLLSFGYAKGPIRPINVSAITPKHSIASWTYPFLRFSERSFVKKSGRKQRNDHVTCEKGERRNDIDFSELRTELEGGLKTIWVFDCKRQKFGARELTHMRDPSHVRQIQLIKFQNKKLNTRELAICASVMQRTRDGVYAKPSP